MKFNNRKVLVDELIRVIDSSGKLLGPKKEGSDLQYYPRIQITDSGPAEKFVNDVGTETTDGPREADARVSKNRLLKAYSNGR